MGYAILLHDDRVRSVLPHFSLISATHELFVLFRRAGWGESFSLGFFCSLYELVQLRWLPPHVGEKGSGEEGESRKRRHYQFLVRTRKKIKENQTCFSGVVVKEVCRLVRDLYPRHRDERRGLERVLNTIPVLHTNGAGMVCILCARSVSLHGMWPRGPSNGCRFNGTPVAQTALLDHSSSPIRPWSDTTHLFVHELSRCASKRPRGTLKGYQFDSVTELR